MIDNPEATGLAVALASIVSLRRDIAELESGRDDLRSQVESAGLRSIIERAWVTDPIATENDLLSAGLGPCVAVLKIDHRQGRLDLAGVQ